MLSPAMSFLKSFSPPGPAEGLRQHQPDTEAVLNGKGLGTGTLYIAERTVSPPPIVVSVTEFFDIRLSRFTGMTPENELIRDQNYAYYRVQEESKEPLSEDEEDSDDEVEPITEFRFVPSDKSALEAMFAAMCECQALHPDPEDEDSDDYDGEEYDVEAHEQGQGDIPTFYTYEEGLSHLTAEGQATLERLEGMLSQSVSSQYSMAGVRTEDSVRDYEDGMEVDTTPAVAGQFEDADVDH
ncbi:methylosome subunit pICln [Nannospalax galili]|nr:methylosome subunit pICln [Nannospalax galili]